MIASVAAVYKVQSGIFAVNHGLDGAGDDRIAAGKPAYKAARVRRVGYVIYYVSYNFELPALGDRSASS